MNWFTSPASWGWVAVIVAVVAVILQAVQVWLQNKTTREQLRVNFYLELRKQFDSPEFRRARGYLAQQFLAKDFQEGIITTPTHDEIQETVMNFFEDMGTLLRRGYLDSELITDTFSYYGLGWWNVCKEYIIEERKTHNNDPTLFSDFEKLATLWKDWPVAGIKDFLFEELRA